jgi:hypothetical protein
MEFQKLPALQGPGSEQGPRGQSAPIPQGSPPSASGVSSPRGCGTIQVVIARHKKPFNLGVPMRPTQWPAVPLTKPRAVSRTALMLHYVPRSEAAPDFEIEAPDVRVHSSHLRMELPAASPLSQTQHERSMEGRGRGHFFPPSTSPPAVRGAAMRTSTGGLNKRPTPPPATAPSPQFALQAVDIVSSREGAEPSRQRKKLLAPALATGAPSVRPFTTSGFQSQLAAWSAPAYPLDPTTAVLAARPLTTPNSANALSHTHPFGGSTGSKLGGGSDRREHADRPWGFNTGSVGGLMGGGLPLLQENGESAPAHAARPCTCARDAHAY